MKLFGFVFTLCLTCALCVSASASALQVVAGDTVDGFYWLYDCGPIADSSVE